MNILLVSGYPESASFGGQLTAKLEEKLQAHAHKVVVSALYKQEFPAVSFPNDFKPRANPDFFDFEAEQRYAFRAGTLPEQIRTEQRKVHEVDGVIFLCPVYWASPPAIMRGWLEQVLTPGFAYEHHRCYETGLLKGRWSFFVVTHAGRLGAVTSQGTSASIEALLDPLEDRPLHYSGFETLPAVEVHPPPYNDPPTRAAALERTLALISERVETIRKRPVPENRISFPLIHLNGRPGIGKKTIGKALARITGGVLIDNHTLLNPGVSACGRGSDGYYRINRAVRHAVFEELMHEIARHPVILTNTLTDQVGEHREIYEEIKRLAHNSRTPLVQVVLSAEVEENARRLESPERLATFKLTDRNELMRLYDSHTIITPDDAIVVDTTGLAPEDSAFHILQRVMPEQKKESRGQSIMA